jgi:hypothetical protein
VRKTENGFSHIWIIHIWEIKKWIGEDMKLENALSIKIDKVDYEELRRIKGMTGVPIVKLVHFAIPLLREKYGVEDGEKR